MIDSESGAYIDSHFKDDYLCDDANNLLLVEHERRVASGQNNSVVREMKKIIVPITLVTSDQ